MLGRFDSRGHREIEIFFSWKLWLEIPFLNMTYSETRLKGRTEISATMQLSGSFCRKGPSWKYRVSQRLDSSGHDEHGFLS